MKKMNKWFQWLNQPVNLPVMAEFDKVRLEAFQMQADVDNFKRAREDAELAEHAKIILEILEKRR